MKKYSLLLLAAYVLLLSASEVFAQIELEAAFPGLPTSGYLAPLGTGKLDFTDDGALDPAFFKTDSEGNRFLIIQDGTDPTNIWILPEIADEVILTFSKAAVMGYFELDGSNSFKEIILAEKKGKRFVNPIVIDINGTVLFDGSNKQLLRIVNMDADICEEIVVFDPSVPQVEIWGEKK